MITNFRVFLESKVKEFKDIRSFDELDKNKIIEIVEYVGVDPYQDQDDVIDDLIDKLEEWKKLPNSVRLYRIVKAKSKEDIDTNLLGEHWTLYDWNLDGDLLLNIGGDIEHNLDAYVIEADFPLSEIDILQTIIQNMNYPTEWEINVRNKGRGGTLVDIYEY